jgi:hypothetical protein
MFADVILSDQLAETVAEIQLAKDPNIHADMRSKNRAGGEKRGRRQRGCSAKADQALLFTREVYQSHARTEIGPYPATPLPEVDQKIKYNGVL